MQEISLVCSTVRLLVNRGGMHIVQLDDPSKHLFLGLEWLDLMYSFESLIETFLKVHDYGYADTLFIGDEPTAGVLAGKETPAKPMLTIHSMKDGSFRFGFVTRPRRDPRNTRSKRVWVTIDKHDIDRMFAAFGNVLGGRTLKLEESNRYWIICGHHGEQKLRFVVNKRAISFEYAPGETICFLAKYGDLWENIADVADFVAEGAVGSYALSFVADDNLPGYTADVTMLPDEMVGIKLYEMGIPWDSLEIPLDALRSFNVIKTELWPQSRRASVSMSITLEYEDDDDDEDDDFLSS